jgi:hypothetical protein
MEESSSVLISEQSSPGFGFEEKHSPGLFQRMAFGGTILRHDAHADVPPAAL